MMQCPAQKSEGMSHTTGMQQPMVTNLSERIGKEEKGVQWPYMSGNILSTLSLMMVTTGLIFFFFVGKKQGEGQQGRYHGRSLL